MSADDTSIPPPGDQDAPPYDDDWLDIRGFAPTPAAAAAQAPPASPDGTPWQPAAEAPPNGAGRHTGRLWPHLYDGLAITRLPPLQPLVDGLLYLPGESVLYSPPKLAKTFMALDLALSTATGQHFMGRATTQGNVVYVAAEGVGGMGARVAAWCDYHGVDELAGASFLATAVNLLNRQVLAELHEILVDRRPILVVLDTLARCAPGADENSAKDMGQLVDALDIIRTTTSGHVLTVHHAGKDPTRGMRGSSALLGAVDTVIELAGDSHAIHCAVTAQKDAEPPDPWWCTVQPHGPSAVITRRGAEPVSNKVLEQVVGALEELPPEDRTSTKWLAMAEDDGVARRTFFRVKADLIARGWVASDGGRGALYRIIQQAAPPEGTPAGPDEAPPEEPDELF